MEGAEQGFDCGAGVRFTPDELAAANINPVTWLATDYLNHFNNVVMLLELIPDMPDMADEIVAWEPVSYTGYFAQSHFRERDLAIAAFHAADRTVKRGFEAAIDELDSAMTDAQALVSGGNPGDPEVAHHIRVLVAERLKPLISRAGGIVNGMPSLASLADQPLVGTAQDSIDEQFP